MAYTYRRHHSCIVLVFGDCNTSCDHLLENNLFLGGGGGGGDIKRVSSMVAS